MRYVPHELRCNAEFMMIAVAKDGHILQYASLEVRSNKDVVLEAVHQDWAALQWASDNIRNSSKIVLAAVSGDIAALQYCGSSLLEKKEFFADHLLTKHGLDALEYADSKLQRDTDLVQQVFQKNNQNREDVKYILQKYGCSGLKFASEDLAHDQELIYFAEDLHKMH